ncbi:MAG: FAD-dependent oxidoreductase [Gammaproteobacteria bacterium]|nr:FAD-dependent oxidoreductase [Gammaproteobacteria bacterium]
MSERYDLIIVGAGIHGAGVAQAAAARGYSVLVLERHGLAHGTSSRSSKLIHGGLRYLETAQLGLVYECLRERARLLRLAPALVRLRQFHFPVYRHTQRRPWQLRLGLSVYALLGGLTRANRFNTVPRRLWDTLDGLETRDLQAVFRYQDAQTDDAALTRAVMHSALALGAELRMPATFLGADLEAREVTVHYACAGETRSCSSRVLVNAAGPWVNAVLDKVRPAPSVLDIDLVQGAHILVPGTLTQGIYYLEAPRDRRAVFVMPWRGDTLVGTTETSYRGDPDAVHALEEEKAYLLETLGRYFPAYASQPGRSILTAYAGLRVLPAGGGTPFTRSRETVLHADYPARPRILSIYGGKLTAYRATAGKVMDRLAHSLPRRTPVADTRVLELKPAPDGQ